MTQALVLTYPTSEERQEAAIKEALLRLAAGFAAAGGVEADEDEKMATDWAASTVERKEDSK